MDLSTALAILGVDANATRAEVRSAYMDLVRVWHPDRFPIGSTVRSKAEAELKLINAAYETLTKVSRRPTTPPTPAQASRPAPSPPPSKPRVEPERAQSPPWALVGGLGLLVALWAATGVRDDQYSIGPDHGSQVPPLTQLPHDSLILRRRPLPSEPSPPAPTGGPVSPPPTTEVAKEQRARISASSTPDARAEPQQLQWLDPARRTALDEEAIAAKYGAYAPPPDRGRPDEPSVRSPRTSVPAACPPGGSQPESGTELGTTPGSSGLGSLTIRNGSQADAIAVLREAGSDAAIRAVYVRRGESSTLQKVAPGAYSVVFQMGEVWLPAGRFCKILSTSKFEDTVQFDETRTATGTRYSRMSLTLYEVDGGNAETEAVANDPLPLPVR